MTNTSETLKQLMLKHPDYEVVPLIPESLSELFEDYNIVCGQIDEPFVSQYRFVSNQMEIKDINAQNITDDNNSPPWINAIFFYVSRRIS